MQWIQSYLANRNTTTKCSSCVVVSIELLVDAEVSVVNPVEAVAAAVGRMEAVGASFTAVEVSVSTAEVVVPLPLVFML